MNRDNVGRQSRVGSRASTKNSDKVQANAEGQSCARSRASAERKSDTRGSPDDAEGQSRIGSRDCTERKVVNAVLDQETPPKELEDAESQSRVESRDSAEHRAPKEGASEQETPEKSMSNGAAPKVQRSVKSRDINE
jgi:hypothetical protein